MEQWKCKMETMVDTGLFNNAYRDKKVLLTGHTGFKGSWLAYWLHELGADVTGLSLDIPTSPNHFDLLQPSISSLTGDIRDFEIVEEVFKKSQPDIVFHLAAQSLVRNSYQYPLKTFDTNIMGTAHMFEAARICKSVKAILNITSDKCYENLETDVAYKETDRMGGYDPYSASKGCAELIVNSYRNSFFNDNDYKSTHHILLASARAGNVIGGGDWADDRLIPDIVKASEKDEPVKIRSPKSTRPWQHVLEPLSGYLLLGSKLLQEEKEIADGWNFGPKNNEALTVEEVLNKMKVVWGNLKYEINSDPHQLHEASLLRLDCSKANKQLNWFPVWDMNTAIEKTANWYKAFYDNGYLRTKEDLHSYIEDARSQQIEWAL